MKKKLNIKKFTLIELIIVIVVIGILSGMALPKFIGVTKDAKVSAMDQDLDVLEKAVTLYESDNDGAEPFIKDGSGNYTKVSVTRQTLKDTLDAIGDDESSVYILNMEDLKPYLERLKYTDPTADTYLYSTKTGVAINEQGKIDSSGMTHHIIRGGYSSNATTPISTNISKFVFSSGSYAYLNNHTLYDYSGKVINTDIEDAVGGYFNEIMVKFDNTHFGVSKVPKEYATETPFKIKTIYNSIWGNSTFLKDDLDNLYYDKSGSTTKVATNVKSILSYSNLNTGSCDGFSYLDNSNKIHNVLYNYNYDNDAYDISDEIIDVGISFKSVAAISSYYADNNNSFDGYYLVDNLGNVYLYDLENSKLINLNISNVNMKQLNFEGATYFVDSDNKIFYISMNSDGTATLSSKKDYLKDYKEVFKGNGFLLGTTNDNKVYISYDEGDTWSQEADFSNIK